MSLESKFDYLVLQWKNYVMNGVGSSGVPVRISSRAEDVSECDAYKEIVKIGRKAIPFIREIYNLDDSQDFPLSVIKGHGLLRLLREIVGPDFSVPEEIRGKINEMANYAKKWIDAHNGRFCQRT